MQKVYEVEDSKRYVLICSFILFWFCGISQTDGYQIIGQLDNYNKDMIYLAMLYGDGQYMVDSASVRDGKFVFSGEYNLKSGVYLVVTPPEKSFFILIDENIPQFSFRGNIDDPDASLVFEGSVENEMYYNYVRFFEGKKADLERVKSEYDLLENDPDKLALFTKMQGIKDEVSAYQKQLISSAPSTLTAAMIKSELPIPEPPGFEGTPEEIQLKNYRYYKAHFFDNTDLSDERLIRSPRKILVDRVDTYLDKMTIQHPDSIIKSIDLLLSKFEPAPDSYKFFVTHFFNKFRESKSMGMDAISVHIANNYIAAGKTPWIEETQKNSILSAIKAIEPTLIGKKAPDFQVQLRDGRNISLHDIESPFVVLFFWSPHCGHCKKSIPDLEKFHSKYRPKGVEVFAVCTKVNSQEADCWEYVDETGMNGWINASDQTGGNSSIHKLYNIKNTPKLYILNTEKTIVAKDIGVEQLEEVMNRIIS